MKPSFTKCPKCGHEEPRKCLECNHIFKEHKEYRDTWKEELEHELIYHLNKPMQWGQRHFVSELLERLALNQKT